MVVTITSVLVVAVLVFIMLMVLKRRRREQRLKRLRGATPEMTSCDLLPSDLLNMLLLCQHISHFLLAFCPPDSSDAKSLAEMLMRLVFHIF